MNERIKKLEGSKSRDAFKKAHKDEVRRNFYASDCDLCLICFEPKGVVAYLDFKRIGDTVTSSEEVLYDEWSKTKPVYIIESPVKITQEYDQEGRTVEKAIVKGPFKVSRYKTGNSLEFDCVLKDWKEFDGWEDSLRREYAKNEVARRSGAKPLHSKTFGKPLRPLQISSRLAKP